MKIAAVPRAASIVPTNATAPAILPAANPTPKLKSPPNTRINAAATPALTYQRTRRVCIFSPRACDYASRSEWNSVEAVDNISARLHLIARRNRRAEKPPNARHQRRAQTFDDEKYAYCA